MFSCFIFKSNCRRFQVFKSCFDYFFLYVHLLTFKISAYKFSIQNINKVRNKMQTYKSE